MPAALIAIDQRPAAAQGEAPPVETPPVDARHQRLLRLFRHTLASGLVNPLLLIVPAYRSEDAE